MDLNAYIIRFFFLLVVGICSLVVIVLKRKWLIEKIKWIDDTFINPGSYFQVLRVVGNNQLIPSLFKNNAKFEFCFEDKLPRFGSKGYWLNGKWTFIMNPNDVTSLDLASYDGDDQLHEVYRWLRLKLHDLFDFEENEGLKLILALATLGAAGIAAFFAYNSSDKLTSVKTMVESLVKVLVK